VIPAIVSPAADFLTHDDGDRHDNIRGGVKAVGDTGFTTANDPDSDFQNHQRQIDPEADPTDPICALHAFCILHNF
jgi:hypothetical protein